MHASAAHPSPLQERVQAAGGTVLNNSGLRVMGILQCTRAIGDKDLRQYGVIPTPDVVSLPRTGQEEFLVLATDGLWDVVSNEVRLGNTAGVCQQACCCALAGVAWAG
jgi:serine/threonine protein phosphatase PrpC